jgi:hypothetical protein
MDGACFIYEDGKITGICKKIRYENGKDEKGRYRTGWMDYTSYPLTDPPLEFTTCLGTTRPIKAILNKEV